MMSLPDDSGIALMPESGVAGRRHGLESLRSADPIDKHKDPGLAR